MTIRRDSIDEAARELGYSRSFLYGMAKARKIPHSRLGGVITVDIEELAAFVDVPVTVDPDMTPPARVTTTPSRPSRAPRRVAQVEVDFDAMG